LLAFVADLFAIIDVSGCLENSCN